MTERRHLLCVDEAAKLGVAVTDRKVAESLDAQDPLAEHRAAFHFPTRSENGEPQLYLCGNSLGLQHRDVEPAMMAMLAKWRKEAVEGWWTNSGPSGNWFEFDAAVRDDIAAIVGAEKDEVVVCNTLTVNLHLLLATFYRPSGKRTKILCEQFPFPSDMQAFVSQAVHHGLSADEVVEIGSNDVPNVVTTEDILNAIEAHKDTAAVLVIGAINFLSGQYFDIDRITKAAQAHGIVVGVDAAHAAGNVPLKLHDWNVDFACWCHYKYLNAGPGNIGGAFVHRKYFGASEPVHPMGTQLRGWWSQPPAARFNLGKEVTYLPNAMSMQISTTNIIGLTAFVPSLRLAASIGIDRLRAKSVALTGYLEQLLDAHTGFAKYFTIITPRDPERRGAQLSVRIHPATFARLGAKQDEEGTCVAKAMQAALLKEGVVADERPPDVIRFALVPTYNSFVDAWDVVEVLRKLLLA